MKAVLFIIPFFFVTALAHAQGVTVSIPPQKYIVDKITQGELNVNVLVPKGSDPHTFSPKSSQIKDMADSTLYLAIGFPFEESTMPQITRAMKTLTVVETQAGIRPVTEAHGDHHHTDPHAWTSPQAMLTIAENTYTALQKAFPDKKFDKGYKELAEEINAIDARFTELFKEATLKEFLVYHPSFSYFARDYGLTQQEIERDGKEPKASELKETIDTAKKNHIKVFIIQPSQPVAASKAVASELKLTPVSIDILDEDWGNMMAKLYNAFDKGR